MCVLPPVGTERAHVAAEFMPKLTIAIDGPAGSGKSSVARRIAGVLGYIYLDSGAMYRALALKALQRTISIEDESALAQLANTHNIVMLPHGRYTDQVDVTTGE